MNTQSFIRSSLLFQQQMRFFASSSAKIGKGTKLNPKYKQTLKFHNQKIKMDLPKFVGGKETLMNGPVTLKVKTTKGPLRSLRYQPIPIHDFMNFKDMTSNEILLNLDNVENLAPSELVGGLIELSNRD